jgi:hypothetical protein
MSHGQYWTEDRRAGEAFFTLPQNASSDRHTKKFMKFMNQTTCILYYIITVS